MHSLARVVIENFRSCQNCAFPLASFTPLVGYNNGGKSNILAAIKWLLQDSTLADTDFCDTAQPVQVSGQIEGITSNLLDALDQKHKERIEYFCRDGVLTIRRIQPSPGAPKKERELEVRDPEVADPDSVDAWKKNPTGIDQAISALFPDVIEIRAMQDAAEDVARSKTTTTIGKLIGEIVAPLEEAHGDSVRQVLAQLSAQLAVDGASRVEELDNLDARANTILHHFFPGIRIAVEVPTPEFKELMKGGTIRVFEGDGPPRDVSALGHGAQRSIQMAMIRLLSEMRGRRSEGSRTLLLIEEPELYLHPQAVEQVRSALHDLSRGAYQVIVSTHSPQMVRQDDLPHALIIHKRPDLGTVPFPTLREAIAKEVSDARAQARTLFELENASQLFFADRVLLVEGTTEKAILPPAYPLVVGRSLSHDRLAIIPVRGSHSLPKSVRVIRSMGIPTGALVDLDFVFRVAPGAGLLAQDDPDLVAVKRIARSLSEAGEFKVDDAGWPTRGNGLTAAEGFRILARDSRSTAPLSNLIGKLKPFGYWVWEKGDIEAHLGIAGKSEDVWAEFLLTLQEEGPDAVLLDPEGVRAMFAWANQPNKSTEDHQA